MTVIGPNNAIDTTNTTVTFAGETLVTGNKNQITYTSNNLNGADPTNKNAGIVTITGTVTVDNGSKLLIVADTEVPGALIAKDRTSESTNGTIEVEGNIFVGTTKAAVYDAKALLKAYNDDLGYMATTNDPSYGQTAGGPVVYVDAEATSTLSGKVELKDGMFITAVPGANIDDSIVEDMKSMTLVIDGKEWITVYGTTAYSMDGLKAPITDATVDKMTDANGDEIDAKYSQVYGVIYGHIAQDLETMGTVYVDLDYNIYTVLIKTDASIKAVYIDGILTYTGENKNQFYLDNIAAGTHTVTVEPATGYTADKAYLYTEMGTLLKGLQFTFDQNDCEKDNQYLVIYNVAGTEKITEVIPEPEQVSEWTITTILLLVLVVLIAIMAVIVALRLNRS